MEDTPAPELSSLLPPNNGNGIRVDYGSSADSLDGNRFHSIHNDASRLHYSLSASLRKIQDSLAPFVDARQSRRASVRDMGGTSTMSNEMFNLTKNLVGAGALGMPSGFAALAGASRSKWAMLPAGAIILVMGASFAYYFILIGRLCRMLDAASYGEAWQKSAGTRGGVWNAITVLVQLSVIGMAGLGSVAYSIIIPDAITSLLERVGIEVERNTCLLVVTIFVLLPLCMVKKLSVLAPFSAVGTAGILCTLAVMGWRCFDGSYDAEQGGRLAKSTQTEMRPLFKTDEPVMPAMSDLFLLLCMCFQAFFSHYNAARFYTELERNTIERYSCVTKVAFGVAGALYFVMGAFGYYTFGAHADGNILNNYSADDDLISICRFLFVVALAFTYPLPFIGARDGVIDLFSVSEERQTSRNLDLLSVVLLSVVTALAWRFPDLGLVNAVGGGALGTGVVFVFPSIMFYFAVNAQKGASRRLRCETFFCSLLMVFGSAVGIFGVIDVVRNS